jgi:hypothetical protein
MPIPIAELQKAAQPLAGRILRFLESRPDEAFSVLEIIEAIEGIVAADVPALILAERRAHGQSPLLERYMGALSGLEHDTLSGCQLISADHGGTRYYGVDPARRAS